MLVLIIGVAAFVMLRPGSSGDKATYSNLVQTVETSPGSISEVVFAPSSQGITATLNDGTVIKTAYPSDQAQIEFQNLLQEKGVKFDSKGTGSSGWSFLIYLLPFVLFIGFFLFLARRSQGGGSKVMSFGKSRAKRMSPDSPKVTFKDVAGADEAVEELHEIKEFLENPKKFQALGARIPKGVLLYGPPGTGKTLVGSCGCG